MGDVVSLVEKAQQEVSEEEAEALAEKMAKGEFTMNDFVKQLRSIRRMGPMKQLLGMLPGVGSMLKDVNVEDGQLDRLEGIVNSMTPDERESLKLLNRSRVKRISEGAGVQSAEVSRLTKQFEMMRSMTQQMAGMGAMGKMGAMRELARTGAAGMPGLPNMPGLGGRGSTKTSSPKQGFKKRKKR